jgi:hypothetical protein
VTTLTDTFDRADSATALNTASDGGTWSFAGGTFGILSNKAYIASLTGTGVSGNNIKTAVRNLSSATCDVTCDVALTSASTNQSLWFAAAYAASDITTAYALRFGATATTMVLVKWSNALGFTTLKTINVTWIPGTITVRVTYDSATGVIKTYVNGSLVDTTTDGSPLTGTWVGLGSASLNSTNGGTWDNFSASSTIAPPPPGGSGSLTLGGSAGGAAQPGAAGALTLGGSAVPPVVVHGSLTLGSPAAEARPVYVASFVVDVGQEASDIPDVTPAAPTVDYTGDDDSDLVDYPDPVLDEFGRPIAS